MIASKPPIANRRERGQTTDYKSAVAGETLESGEFKGWNKGVRNIVSILPFFKTIKRALSPEVSKKWLDNN